jgi:hypothetical protein
MQYDRRFDRLEHLLYGGLPLHRPLAMWLPHEWAQLERPEVLASLSDAALERLIAECEALAEDGPEAVRMHQGQSVVVDGPVEVNPGNVQGGQGSTSG